MAVINCPQCNKKISDKAKVCPHCELTFEDFDQEKFSSMKKINFIKKSQRIMTYSFIAMLLFCGGFLYYYSQNVQLGTTEFYLSVGAVVIGFFMYIATRIQLILLKRRRK
ncbi:hypothetical protein Q4489_16390 [Thalassotalea sp. 1_MG-2023]|uniref:zinc ribbon domain-containing protein n=1 Tax=Thalassotalea sp. 1_MG-2023 TaxID=3062680 RepID=UPI0026E30302|nr:zinc ribbon domain-containing protein [Thalassotalea sp. 1_MG-2023]MDO6428593.1 hypothetical protein [Thalassotalea sp. 1_MG-2023]